MKRRDCLRLSAGALALTTAGCLSSIRGDDSGHEDLYLGTPENPAGNVRHPRRGDEIPEAEFYDVFTDGYVSTDRDGAFLMTFFYSFCPTECIWLISSLTHAEASILEADVEEPRILAVTFDPERDTPEALVEYADRMGVDRESGNWSFLRPDGEEEAERVLGDEFGISFSKTDEGDLYDFMHSTVVLLVNEDGYVERTYRRDNPDPDRIAEDWVALAEAQEQV